MGQRQDKAGSTTRIITVTLRDSTSVAYKTGIAYGSVAYSYTREGDSARANGTCVTTGGGVDTFTDHGWIEISAANQPGKYQFGCPSGMVAAGAISAKVTFEGAGFIDKEEPVLLTAYDPQDAVRMGQTALPNAVPGSENGVLIAGSNAATTFDSLTVTHAFNTGDFLINGNWRAAGI